ncbi:MAG: GDSL-type esterase/lipase family protein [Flavobacteriaceae bacterium]|nr:GDSL-type esterase/lipase family protein [Flavobacteriaceae bacterium]
MKAIFVTIMMLIAIQLYSQQNHFFYKEVQKLNQQYQHLNKHENPILFTGSSSIRMWKDLQSRYPNNPIINTGFGGSTMYDLEVFLKDLVLQYRPKLIFIYEGDNDISGKIKIKTIKKTTKRVLRKIQLALPNSKVVLISAKPSISRWHLRRKYKRLNRFFKRYSKKQQQLQYANIWDVMLHKRKLKKDIFLSDGLHLNKKGYDLWDTVIRTFL